MKQIVQVSVGIPAYNEEKNIAKVVRNVLAQKQEGWKLKEVFVCSDGSSDGTVKRTQSSRSRLVHVIGDTNRKGKVARVQELYKKLQGDIFVMFDGDVQIPSKNLITHLIQPFVNNTNVMLVGGNPKVHPPKTFLQRAVYSTFKVFYQSRIQIRNGNNVAACVGSCYSLRKKFAKQITFPKIKNEDAYVYFLCKVKKYGFAFVPEAIIYYKLPMTLSDYLSQVFRSDPKAVYLSLQKHFGELVNKEFERGNVFYAKNVLKVFLEDPLPVAFIIGVNLVCKPLFQFISNPDKLMWESVKSTKVI